MPTKKKPHIRFSFDKTWLTIDHMTKQLREFIREIERFSNADLDPSSVRGEITIYWEPSEYPKSQQRQFLSEYRKRVAAETERLKKLCKPLPDPELSLPENIRIIREEED